jgi:tetratricopeptide (TPR) repeat protein
MTLSREVADKVARHLVAAGQVIDEDADLAMAHAIAARRLASRIAVVREAVGLAAYAAGDWATAIAELRTYHRMTGRQTHLAELADCERALGRPERAIDLFRGADRDALDKGGAIELLIVAAGARIDLGQYDAAVAMLQVRELTADEDGEWAARLRYAYADALLAAGRREEAREWFSRAAALDTDEMTDAAERLLELDGVTIEGESDDDDEDDDGDDSLAGVDDDADNSFASTDVDDDDEDDEDDEGVDDSLASAEVDDDDEDAEDAEDDAEDDEVLAGADSRDGVGSQSTPESDEDVLAGDDPADEDWSAEHKDAARPRAVAFVDGVESAFDSDDDLDDTDDLDVEDARADVAATDVAEADRGVDAADGLGVGAGLDDRLGDDVDGDIDTPATTRSASDGDDHNRDDDEKAGKDEFVAQAAVPDEPGDKRPSE